ncbi:MAPEG family protein [Parvularcula dongshanensis]|uniref:MAPEG family protein n=1 Tax=Parvularcula dongshanensis TaxID=1173995 RepID=A0A840I5I1_9PROT|nr:MAPEG family protein [Parvularcula dongshanensis]MBB4660057.1 hypothetical protein [Parvularcula dongshanensis]
MYSIFLPVLIQVGLSLTLLFVLPTKRMRDLKSDPALAERARTDTGVYAEDAKRLASSYSNQFELPVLFYVGAVFAILFGLTNWWTGLLAWLFVASRIGHAVIHNTNNNLRHRFYAFAVGPFVLAIFWLTIAFEARGSLIFDMKANELAREAQQDFSEEIGLVP